MVLTGQDPTNCQGQFILFCEVFCTTSTDQYRTQEDRLQARLAEQVPAFNHPLARKTTAQPERRRPPPIRFSRLPPEV
ncbi:hypothetical protein MiSe_19060 [Microseira wollei NIES-4236]|uniref:Uncharacterized protein n=1 Tax=Microseira wollei NIES-4236 TaxID=2530354 RepID=A0AAV3X722_9CYAN|nr:hypothetical protein MiSe_19060 [Microseira wollei NIES-4236]